MSYNRFKFEDINLRFALKVASSNKMLPEKGTLVTKKTSKISGE